MKFVVSSGKLIVSDPCYYVGNGCNVILENVKNGTWEVSCSKNDDNRIDQLSAFCEEVKKYDCSWEELKESVAVDSGQAGIFDLEKYRKDKFIEGKVDFDRGTDDEGEKFYCRCCDITLSNEKVGVVANSGVVSSSGYGDGCYRCFVLKDTDNKIFGVKISFIDDYEDDGEYCDEYDEEEQEDDEN
jgi:hypothetical protein